MGMGPLPEDHHCPYREQLQATTAERVLVKAKFEALFAKVEMLERRIFGPTSEKMPPVASELARERTAEDAEDRRIAALERREQRRADKAKLRTETTIHHVAEAQRHCPRCGGDDFAALGTGKASVVFEYVPGYFVLQEHVRETLACRCEVVGAESAVAMHARICAGGGPSREARAVPTAIGE